MLEPVGQLGDRGRGDVESCRQIRRCEGTVDEQLAESGRLAGTDTEPRPRRCETMTMEGDGHTPQRQTEVGRGDGVPQVHGCAPAPRTSDLR